MTINTPQRKKYIKDIIIQNRDFLKAPDWEKMPPNEDWQSDQQLGVNPPVAEKPYPQNAHLVDLTPLNELRSINFNISLFDAIINRKSRRKFTQEALTLEELSLLLYTTQGLRLVGKDIRHGQTKAVKKTVPSGGSRHPFETYLVINRVQGLKKGIYRYISLEHKLLLLKEVDQSISETISKLTWGQNFCGESAVFFMWSVIPYRSEWRYSIIAHKDILIEAGHICQNLYLTCEAIKSGTCAILAYDQKGIDELLCLDGEEEFVIYVAPVGKVSK
jgi:SagB-type dehydrogenase family enzyme